MNVDVVIIGLNPAATLASCINNVLNTGYNRGSVQIYYVDSGSTDGSVEIARGFAGVRIVELAPDHPSPGGGRNAGWKAGSAPLVQFLDSDTEMDAQWLDKAIDALDGEVGAVRGNRIERHPENSVFNWIADQEWNAAPGECADFGGDVLIRRSALEVCRGYDEILVGGEDPELSQRVRKLGWKIIQLNQPMTTHDLAMNTIPQYWKRGFRTGYGFAAVVDRHHNTSNRFWFAELKRIIVRGGGGPVLMGAGLLLSFLASPVWLVVSIMGAFLLMFPRLLRVGYFASDKGLSTDEARIYSWHCSAVVLPEFFGVVRYAIAKFFDLPLRNRPPRPVLAVVGALLVLIAMSSCSVSGIKTGVSDLHSADKYATQPEFNVGGIYEGQEAKQKKTFASEDELKKFSDAVPEEYYLGPGDIMAIQIREREEISVKEITVSPDGKIALPQMGIIDVRGKTTADLTDLITMRLSELYEKPDVTVLVQEFNNNKVYVLGRVTSPGLIKFGGTGTLLEALAQSGGLPTVAEDAFLSRAMIFRGSDTVLWVDLGELLQNGNVAMNPKLLNNDIVYIPDSDDELAYVMGEVESPGAVRLKGELSVLDAVMASGGPTKDAKIAKTYLIRFKDGKGHVQQVDINRFLKSGDMRQDYLLSDGDIVYVSTRPIADISYAITKLSPTLSYLNLAGLVTGL